MLKAKRRRLRQIESVVSLPQGTLYRALYMEFSANRRVVVNGCCRIGRYEQNIVTLETVDGTVTFEGDALCIECIENGGAVVSGNICTVSFGE